MEINFEAYERQIKTGLDETLGSVVDNILSHQGINENDTPEKEYLEAYGEAYEKLQEHITLTWGREKVKRRELREQRLTKERIEKLPDLVEQELERYPSAGTMAFKTSEERDFAAELFKKKGFLVHSYIEEDAYCVNYGHCEQDLYAV